MIRIKAFLSDDLADLEENINIFLEEHPDYTIFDYKYEITNKIVEIEGEEEIEVDQSILYTCLLMYCIKS